jgi:hypothetical protein
MVLPFNPQESHFLLLFTAMLLLTLDYGCIHILKTSCFYVYIDFAFVKFVCHIYP